MFWQLWVLVVAVASGLLIFVTVRFRHAQKVFDHIIDQLDDPAACPDRDALTHVPVRDAPAYDGPVDELARRRRTSPALVPHSAHRAHPRSRHR
jgi:hypothetical protein